MVTFYPVTLVLSGQLTSYVTLGFQGINLGKYSRRRATIYQEKNYIHLISTYVNYSIVMGKKVADRPTGHSLSTLECTPFTVGRFHLFCLPFLQHGDKLST